MSEILYTAQDFRFKILFSVDLLSLLYSSIYSTGLGLYIRGYVYTEVTNGYHPLLFITVSPLIHPLTPVTIPFLFNPGIQFWLIFTDGFLVS